MLNKTFLTGAIAVALALGNTPALAQSVTTAQSVMFATEMTGNFVILDTEVWQFAKTDAKTFFANGLSGITVACSPKDKPECAATNQPATPPAPAPDPARLNSVAENNACTFWSGGALAGDTYTKQSTAKGKNGKGTWAFTYTYTIAGMFSTVPARTAWVLQSSNASPAVVTLTGYIAGQSTQKASNTAKRKADWTFKASHSLLNPDGTARIDGLQTSLVWDGGQVGTPLAYTLETGVDFYYQQNAGTNGATSQLVDGASVNTIQNGGVGSAAGDYDNFAGNNGTLGERAVLAPVSWAIPEAGQYTLAVTGTVKGVAGGFDLPFTISKVITVSAGKCSQ